jgi:hypothetical protein
MHGRKFVVSWKDPTFLHFLLERRWESNAGMAILTVISVSFYAKFFLLTNTSIIQHSKISGQSPSKHERIFHLTARLECEKNKYLHT